jgi:hypothetical protein
MIRSILWAAPLVLAVTGLLHAQDSTALNDLKAKIWEADIGAATERADLFLPSISFIDTPSISRPR